MLLINKSILHFCYFSCKNSRLRNKYFISSSTQAGVCKVRVSSKFSHHVDFPSQGI